MQNPTGAIQTVRGLIEREALGPTLMHEHVATDLTPPEQRGLQPAEITLETVWDLNYDWVDAPGLRDLSDIGVATREIMRMVDAGGKSIVDVSTRGMVCDPAALRRISEQTDTHIILGCGRYVQEFMSPEDVDICMDSLTSEFVSQIKTGFGDTGVKAGIIGEIGCSWPLTASEEKSLIAAAHSQQESGLALTIHPGRHRDSPFEIVKMLKEAGADLTRTVMDHVERRLFDAESILALADTGVTVEFDLFGFETSRFGQADDVDLSSDGARLTWVRA